MIKLGYRNLLHSKTKTAISIGGVAFCLFLVILVSGVYNAMGGIMEDMVVKTGADLWITQKGTSGSVHSPSVISESVIEKLSGIKGIDHKIPLIRSAVTWSAPDGSTVLLFINGIMPHSTLGNPWNIERGNNIRGPGEIMVDSSFARLYDFKPGDDIVIQDRTFRISGLTGSTNVMVGYSAFINLDDARSFLRPGLVNSILVSLEAGASREQVVHDLDVKLKDDDVRISTSADLAENYKKEVLGSFEPIILLLSVVSIIIGVLVVGLLIYMLTLERMREYGILKASGASGGYLFRIVLVQALLISIIGSVAGGALSVPLLILIKSLLPQLVVTFDLNVILATVLMFSLSGALSAMIPLRIIRTIDPAFLFR